MTDIIEIIGEPKTMERIAKRSVTVYKHEDGTVRLRKGLITADDRGQVHGMLCVAYLDGRRVHYAQSASRNHDGTGWVLTIDKNGAPSLLTGQVECLLGASRPYPDEVAT